jgi:sterol desaturase/sphingolipid hydroxylase (fatty acid hydroxylase superfamily)
MIAVFLLAGIATWSLLEYLLHRFAGHDRRLVGRNAFGREHSRHHAEGGYFAPSWKKVLAASGLATVVGVLAGAWRSPNLLIFMGGLLGCYAVYEILHRRLHTHSPRNRYGAWARHHHFHHHFEDIRKNHGVTSPIWDLVFGTYARPTSVAVPERLAMPWLCDAAGDVRPAYAASYSLRRRHGGDGGR